MPKKICIFSLAYYPQTVVGGAEVAIKEITDRIDPTDIEFHLITLGFDSAWPKTERIGNVIVHRIGFGKKHPSEADLKKFPLHLNKHYFQIAAALKAWSLHRKHQFDAIWAMMAHSSGIPAAIYTLLRPRVPYILTLQEGDPTEYIEKLMRPVWPLFSRAFTRATIVQVISHFLGDWARRRGFTGPIEFIPNGANPRNFTANYTPEELATYETKVGKKPGETLLVTTSRLAHKNAIDQVIRALPLLPQTMRFVVVGGGPEEDSLKKIAQELGVSERVVFIGQVDRTETPKYLKISDIYVRPSRSEGFGNSFASAMAARLPIIATQVGGISDFLFDAKRNPDKQTTGWAVDVDSPEQIAQAVQDILQHPEQVQKVTETSYQLVFGTYNWDIIAKNMRSRVFEFVFQKKI